MTGETIETDDGHDGEEGGDARDNWKHGWTDWYNAQERREL